jgi:hypothetical protein
MAGVRQPLTEADSIGPGVKCLLLEAEAELTFLGSERERLTLIRHKLSRLAQHII